MCFDYKMATARKNIPFKELEKKQIVNHFENNGLITTKKGLSDTIKRVSIFKNVDPYSFYPKSFILNNPVDAENFIEEYKVCEAESILIRFVKTVKKNKKVSEMFKV